MANLPAINADIIEQSQKHGIAIVFATSKAPTYQLAINIAKTADFYTEFPGTGKNIFHVAAFNIANLKSAMSAAALLAFVENWTATKIFIRGRILNFTDNPSKVLKCYSQACLIKQDGGDYRAHCFRIVDHPDNEEIREHWATLTLKWIDQVNFNDAIKPKVKKTQLPCQLLTNFLEVSSLHEASIQDQIHALAVERGIDICPFFNSANYKEIEQEVRIEI